MPPVSHHRSKVSRLPLRVRTVADVEALRVGAGAVRRLPRAGLEVTIPGMDPLQVRRFENRIRAYIRSCGCAEGAAAALFGMLLVLGWIALRMSTRGPEWSNIAAAVAGVLLAVLFGALGKLLGLAIARLRFERCCLDVIQTLNKR